MPRTVREAEEIYKEAEIVKQKIKSSFPAFLRMAVIGVVVFAVVTLGSIFISSNTVIEAGQAASVGYSLQ